MAIFRGIGGAGDSTTDATVTEVTQQAVNAANSATAAASSASSAASSASNAATSEANAATSESNASTSATNASNSASAASDSATAAQTAQTNAETAETNAETAQGLAESAQTAAETAQGLAEDAQAAAEEAQNLAESSELSALDNANTAVASAANAADSETNAANSATSANTSATEAASSASTALSAKDDTEALYDDFDDRYLGPLSSDPVTDNDGDALVVGALYYDTVNSVVKVYDGSQWLAAYASLGDALSGANNLSDVSNVTESRENLELGADDTVTFAEANLDYIDLATDQTPSHQEGRVFYDASNKALAVYNDEADITLQVGQEEWIRVYNNSGSTITNGSPLYTTGSTAGYPTVALADATTEAKSRVIGLATHHIENNTYGYCTVRGFVRDFDTSALTAGETVHVSSTGTLQTTAPTYPYFPEDVGICIVSDSTNGIVYVRIVDHTFEQVRVTGNGHVDGNFTVEGNFTVSGTQTIANEANLAVSNAYIYLSSGDTIGEANTTFTGSGLDDAYFTGHYNGTTTKTFYVRIDGVGTGTGGVDTFEWSLDNFSTTEATGVDITGANQELSDNVSIFFNATTGHTSGDLWSGTAAPTNVDTGFWSNRNTGETGIGYTHLGFYYDVSDNKFKMVDAYAPEPDGTINTSDPSFSIGTLVADIEGTLTGNVTGDVTGNASTATTLTGLTEEITDAKVTNWNTAYGWGDHSTQGYLTSIEGFSISSGTLTTANITTANITTVDLGDWTITEAGGVLYFATGGVNKMKLDASGNLTAVGDVTAFGSI